MFTAAEELALEYAASCGGVKECAASCLRWGAWKEATMCGT